jgi:hypothetical protein
MVTESSGEVATDVPRDRPAFEPLAGLGRW